MSVLKNTINRMMSNNGEDIGLDRGGQRGRQRSINADGSFNMERKTGNILGSFHLYQWLITTSWKHYWLSVGSFYFFANIFFGALYYVSGSENLYGIPNGTEFQKLLYCFFFSTQSFTTVGYGGIHPIGVFTSSLAAVEAFLGITTFALVTGTLYGRFSKASAKLKYSANAIIAPFKEGKALMFMVANQRSTQLMEMEARVNYGWIEKDEQGDIRRFQQLKLEIDKIAMFPSSWTVVHPIDEDSPLWNINLEEIHRIEAEIFVLIKGFDETFSQTIYSRNSYMHHELLWGAKFRRPFFVNNKGKLVMNLEKVGEFDRVQLK